MHCDKAPCIESCPVPGALYQRNDGMVIIDAVKCTGCRNCVDACPYDVIFFNEDLNLAQKCTGCAHLLDDGWTEPRCADSCPTLAIRMLDEADAQELIAKAEIWKPELREKVRPRVYYLNLPKRFIAGTLYEPADEEVIIGAVATLKGADGRTYTTETDSYGDFWFEGIGEGVYDLELRYAGKVKTFTGLDTTERDINLGDIPLT
jgi:ferredoxin